VGEADAERTVGDDLREGEIGSFDIEVSFHYLERRGEGAEEGVGGRIGEIAETEDRGDFVRSEELLEL
jgi:hypothetical protein